MSKLNIFLSALTMVAALTIANYPSDFIFVLSLVNYSRRMRGQWFRLKEEITISNIK